MSWKQIYGRAGSLVRPSAFLLPHLAMCSWEEGLAPELSQRPRPPSSVPVSPRENHSLLPFAPACPVSPERGCSFSLLHARARHGGDARTGGRWKKDTKSVSRALGFASEAIRHGQGIRSCKSQLATSGENLLIGFPQGREGN